MKTDFVKRFSAMQAELKAPKGQFNKFGGYAYRSCEDIVESAKPIAAKYGLVINLSDDIVLVGERYYVRAVASITDGEDVVESSALAREEETKKGMDGSQITGAASSYARKYALNGLLMIDDTKDSDTTNTGDKPEARKVVVAPQVKQDEQTLDEAIAQMESSASVDEAKAHWFANVKYQSNKIYSAKTTEVRNSLTKK